MLADACSDGASSARLRHLASPAGKEEYAAHISRDGRDVAELLDDFPSCSPPWSSLLELCPKLTPRYYTISSSPASDPHRAHLTVKAITRDRTRLHEITRDRTRSPEVTRGHTRSHEITRDR